VGAAIFVWFRAALCDSSPARISVVSGASFRPSSREVLFPFWIPHPAPDPSPGLIFPVDFSIARRSPYQVSVFAARTFSPFHAAWLSTARASIFFGPGARSA
jgi:hypothetical protein